MAAKQKQIKQEAELINEALRVGMRYAEKRGAAKFEETDSRDDKIEFVYRLLVHDGLLQPLAKEDLSLINMKHKLARWIARQLPANHPLSENRK